MCVLRATHTQHQENTPAGQFTADYATAADFCAIFQEDTPSLYRLAYLLTADQGKAEQCFVSGLEDCHGGNPVFREWARSWAKRVIIKNAIVMLTPLFHSANHSLKSPRSGHDSGLSPWLSAVTQLPPLERVAFVLTVLEKHSVADCALLMGCSTSEVNRARNHALQELSVAHELPQHRENCPSPNASLVQLSPA